MDKKICALELATYLVRQKWSVYVSCSSLVDVSIHLDYLEVPKLQQILNSLKELYDFTFKFEDCSDLSSQFYVCYCRF